MNKFYSFAEACASRGENTTECRCVERIIFRTPVSGGGEVFSGRTTVRQHDLHGNRRECDIVLNVVFHCAVELHRKEFSLVDTLSLCLGRFFLCDGGVGGWGHDVSNFSDK